MLFAEGDEHLASLISFTKCKLPTSLFVDHDSLTVVENDLKTTAFSRSLYKLRALKCCTYFLILYEL